MLKFLIFILSMFLSFNAEALVKQSASKALSYRNIADDSGASRRRKAASMQAPVKKEISEQDIKQPAVVPPKLEKVDLSGKDTEVVLLKRNDKVEITLPERDGYHWDLNPDSSNLALLSNKVIGNSRVITYKLVSDKAAYIYFDDINNFDGSIQKTKQLTINLRE